MTVSSNHIYQECHSEDNLVHSRGWSVTGRKSLVSIYQVWNTYKNEPRHEKKSAFLFAKTKA